MTSPKKLHFSWKEQNKLQQVRNTASSRSWSGNWVLICFCDLGFSYSLDTSSEAFQLFALKLRVRNYFVKWKQGLFQKPLLEKALRNILDASYIQLNSQWNKVSNKARHYIKTTGQFYWSREVKIGPRACLCLLFFKLIFRESLSDSAKSEYNQCKNWHGKKSNAVNVIHRASKVRMCF